MFNNALLRDKVAFRGGTALGKLYLQPQIRYSEDIDLVQIENGPIKQIIDGIRESLSFLGSPKVKQTVHNNTLRFTFDSEIPPINRMKLKIEVNTREHFAVMGYVYKSFNIENDWFTGAALLKTYSLEEMAGTKMRALYQRKKGRDLFDLYRILRSTESKINRILDSYTIYMNHVTNNLPTRKEYILNLSKKVHDPDFIGDLEALLPPGTDFNISEAYDLVIKELIEKL
jgi:predicted nucleotidyltransferase component of viral defense system